MIDSFQFSSLPEIMFGKGKRCELPAAVASIGRSVLLLTGSASFYNLGHGDEIVAGLKKANLEVIHEVISHEPSPLLIDQLVAVCDLLLRCTATSCNSSELIRER